MKKITILLTLIAFIFCSCSKDKNKRERFETTGWEIPTHEQFEFSMTFTGQVEFPRGISKDTKTEVAVFHGEECRGKAFLTYEEAHDLYLFYLTVYSNTISGENLTLKVYDPQEKYIYDIDEKIAFKSNESLGSASHIVKAE